MEELTPWGSLRSGRKPQAGGLVSSMGEYRERSETKSTELLEGMRLGWMARG